MYLHVTEHVLKTHPAQFDAVARGVKTFEVRKDDRGYQRGDILILHRCRNDRVWEVETQFASREPKHVLRKRVIHILTGGQYGIEPGYVVMALADVEEAALTTEKSNER